MVAPSFRILCSAAAFLSACLTAAVAESEDESRIACETFLSKSGIPEGKCMHLSHGFTSMSFYRKSISPFYFSSQYLTIEIRRGGGLHVGMLGFDSRSKRRRF